MFFSSICPEMVQSLRCNRPKPAVYSWYQSEKCLCHFPLTFKPVHLERFLEDQAYIFSADPQDPAVRGEHMNEADGSKNTVLVLRIGDHACHRIAGAVQGPGAQFLSVPVLDVGDDARSEVDALEPTSPLPRVKSHIDAVPTCR